MSKDRTRGLAVVVASAIVLGITYTDQASIIPLIRADLDVTDVRAGLMPTALFIASIVTIFLSGGLMDRDPRSFVGLGLLIAVIGNAAFGLATSYEALLVTKAVAGVGSGMAFVAGTRYVAGIYRGSRSHLGQGLYGAGYPLGGAIGLWVMPPLALALTGWRGAFIAVSIPIALVTIAWWLAAPAVERIAGARADIRDALRDGNSWWCFVEHIAGFGMQIIAGSWVSLYFLRELGASLVLAGALGSVLLFSALVLRTIGGYLVSRERIGTIALMRASQVASLVAIGLLALPERPLAVALAAVLLLGAGAALPYSAVFNTAAASVPRAPGAAQSLAAIGGTFGALVGSPFMGAVIERAGFTGAWLSIALIPGVALVGTFLMKGEEELTR